MQRNFSKYVADVEMQKLDLVIQNLAEVYAVYHDWGNAIQAQILRLMKDLQAERGTAILFITHDLGVIAEMADYVVVMYAGRIIEQGTASEIFHKPCHPYTQVLQKSKPTMKSAEDKLFNIPGNVPNPINMPNHCYFKERCSQCTAKCSGEYPGMVQVSPTHFVACHLSDSKED